MNVKSIYNNKNSPQTSNREAKLGGLCVLNFVYYYKILGIPYVVVADNLESNHGNVDAMGHCTHMMNYKILFQDEVLYLCRLI